MTNLKPIFLMSPPRNDWALKGKANFKSQVAMDANAEKARYEWSQLANAIVAAGGEVVVCPPDMQNNMTGLIYTAEAGEFYRLEDNTPAFLLPNMAVAHRRDEAAWLAQFVSHKLGFRVQHTKAIWEAQGDAIRGVTRGEIIHTYGVGQYQRTSKQAYFEVCDLLSPRHIQLEFRANPWFHGNTFLQVFRHETPNAVQQDYDGLCLICPDALAPIDYERLKNFLGARVKVVDISIEESQGYDTNSLQVNDTVIASGTLSATARQAIEAFGLKIQTLELAELFLKGGGAPVCLTNRLWGLTDDELPLTTRWSNNPDIEAHC